MTESTWTAPMLKDSEGFYFFVHPDSVKELDMKEDEFFVVTLKKQSC